MFANRPETEFGIYIHKYLEDVRNNMYKIERFGIHTGTYLRFNLEDKEAMILFVVSTVYNYNLKWDVETEKEKQKFHFLKEYYENYKKYFNLIR